MQACVHHLLPAESACCSVPVAILCRHANDTLEGLLPLRNNTLQWDGHAEDMVQRDKKTKKPLMEDGKPRMLTSHTLNPVRVLPLACLTCGSSVGELAHHFVPRLQLAKALPVDCCMSSPRTSLS